MKEGDLIWIPSDTCLIKLDNETRSPNLWCKVKEPTHAVLLNEVDDTYCNVIYRGEKWTALKSDVYSTEEAQVAS